MGALPQTPIGGDNLPQTPVVVFYKKSWDGFVATPQLSG
jgi:hypothetical protein